jgi:dolichol-phosphate mannosyltransferase
MPDPGDTTLSVCVEAYNEVGNLRGAVAELVDTLAPALSMLQVIIVDDGSTDGTAEVADALAREYAQVEVVHHATNHGIGAAFRSAVSVATQEYFTDFPGDHENSADEILALLKHAGPGTLAVAMYRDTGTRAWYRRVISRLFVWSVNVLSGTRVQYYNGLTVYPCAAIKSIALQSNGFVYSSEAIIRLRRRGYQHVMVPYELRGRDSGASKALTLRSLRCVACELLGVIISVRFGRDAKETHAAGADSGE